MHEREGEVAYFSLINIQKLVCLLDILHKIHPQSCFKIVSKLIKFQ